ncbi:MAG TPA: hypothetical protein VIJ75_00445 [Hanamia sp.]
MSTKSEKVKSGYSELDYSEREDVKKFIKEFDDASIEKRKVFSEGLRTTLNKSLGPTSSWGCPCCGK